MNRVLIPKRLPLLRRVPLSKRLPLPNHLAATVVVTDRHRGRCQAVFLPLPTPTVSVTEPRCPLFTFRHNFFRLAVIDPGYFKHFPFRFSVAALFF